MTPKATHSRPAKRSDFTGALCSPQVDVSAGELDPFDTLAVDFSRLQILLGNGNSLQHFGVVSCVDD